jgi:glycosyltransferase involved in cell wall biosynthesis
LLASLKFRFPKRLTDELAYLSKLWIDCLSEAPARQSDVFLFYNGAGLRTATRLRGRGVVRVVEVVNSHVLAQERIMREEHECLKLPFIPFHRREVARRLEEYREAEAVLCPSRFVKRSFISEGVPEEKLAIVHYGLEPQGSKDEPERKGDIFRVLYVGQISVRKGVRYLIQAFAGLKRANKELLVVGPRSLVTGIDDLQLAPNVELTGALKGDALAAVYRSASVFVLPSIEDGMGLVIGEALSFGLPVVATVNTGAADLFTDGVEGWQVPIRDPGAIREKLQMLADGPDLLKTMSAAAEARSRSLGGWEVAGKALVSTLRSLATPCG